MLSPAVEDYLKTIYKLDRGGPVAAKDLASSLGVSAASVTNMAKRLGRMGLVQYASYRGVALTDAGRKVALEIIRHHRLLETYLREIMGYGWEEMHAEAEQLEHHISEAFEQRIDEMLGYPTHDPHGDPIPTADGRMPASAEDPLHEMLPGQRFVVQRVSDQDPLVLHDLEDRGLMPGAVLQVERIEALHVTVSLDGEEQRIERDLAQHVFVGEVANE